MAEVAGQRPDVALGHNVISIILKLLGISNNESNEMGGPMNDNTVSNETSPSLICARRVAIAIIYWKKI